MAKAAQFAQRMSALGKQINTRRHNQVNKLALAIQLKLLQVTPVDTAQAISNWILSLSSPSDEFIHPYSPGQYGSTRQVNIGQAYNVAMAAISDRRPNQTIYIVNSAPYIVKLNNGSSTQAPSGFFQTEIQNAVRSFRGLKVLTL